LRIWNRHAMASHAGPGTEAPCKDPCSRSVSFRLAPRQGLIVRPASTPDRRTQRFRPSPIEMRRDEEQNQQGCRRRGDFPTEPTAS
jgi:hypothetical protein